MNKYQEALNRIKVHVPDYRLINNHIVEVDKHSDLSKLQELIDKETPMKPLEVEDSHFICKSCNETIVPIGQRKVWHNIFTKYHNCCGQKLDWSDEE